MLESIRHLNGNSKKTGRFACVAALLTLGLALGGCSRVNPFARSVASFRATLVDELEPLYPDSTFADKQPEPFRIDAARGTIAGTHLLLEGLPLASPLRIEAIDSNTALADGAEFYRLIDVPVEINTGINSRTEKWDGKRNPYVIRRAPFRVYDALRPLESDEIVDTATIALSVQIPIAADATPGEYEIALRVAVGKRLVSKKMLLAIHPAVVPPIGCDTLGYTNWASLRDMVKGEKIEMWSEEFWTVLDRYAAMMARGRQNTILVPLEFRKGGDGHIALNRPRLKRFVDLFTRHGFYYIEGSHLARADGNKLKTGIGKYLVQSPEGTAELVETLDVLQGFIKDEGLEKRWLQHIKDEPGDDLAEDYGYVADLIHKHLSGVPVLEATVARKLVGAVDAWCPTVDVYQQHKEFFDKRQADGDTVWVYTCLTPTGPWVNRLIDQERLRPVYVGWGAEKFGTQGFLHWGLNRGANPFKQSVVDHPQAPNTNNQLPAGDTHVLYPGPREPWSSTRFEAHRIGMEDRELLRQIKEKNPDLCRRIIGSVFRGYDDYETDVAAYRFAKRRLLEALGE